MELMSLKREVTLMYSFADWEVWRDWLALTFVTVVEQQPSWRADEAV